MTVNGAASRVRVLCHSQNGPNDFLSDRYPISHQSRRDGSYLPMQCIDGGGGRRRSKREEDKCLRLLVNLSTTYKGRLESRNGLPDYSLLLRTVVGKFAFVLGLGFYYAHLWSLIAMTSEFQCTNQTAEFFV